MHIYSKSVKRFHCVSKLFRSGCSSGTCMTCLMCLKGMTNCTEHTVLFFKLGKTSTTTTVPSDSLQTHFSGLPNSGRCHNFWLCSHLSVQQSDLYKAALVMCNPFSGHGSDATLRQSGLEGSYFARPKSERVSTVSKNM